MKISIKLISAGIELVKDVIFSPCTAEALTEFIRRVVADRFGSLANLNHYRPQLGLFDDSPKKYGDVMVLLVAEDDDGDMLSVKTSLEHVLACSDSFVFQEKEQLYVLETPDDVDDWLRSRYFYLDDDLPTTPVVAG